MEKPHPDTLHCFLLSPIFCGNGAPASHWWLRLGSSGLPQDKASSQTCHYFLANYCADGQKRCWDKPISARAYLGKIHEAARSLTQDKTAAAASGAKHAFQDFPVHKLGTHSVKKSAVTLMAEAAVSWSIISGVTGTSVRVLQNTYDISTLSRQGGNGPI